MTVADFYHFFYGTESLNYKLLMLINHSTSQLLDVFMPAATFLGGSNLFPFYVLLLLAVHAIDKKSMPVKYLAAYLVAAVISYGVESVLKDLFHVPRPPFALGAGSVRVLGIVNSTYALPSGHAVFSFMTATTVAFGRGRWCKVLLFLCALLVAYSRVYMGHHYPLDVVAGAFVGTGCALAGLILCGCLENWYRLRKQKSSP